jgi:hypothetical protein
MNRSFPGLVGEGFTACIWGRAHPTSPCLTGEEAEAAELYPTADSPPVVEGKGSASRRSQLTEGGKGGTTHRQGRGPRANNSSAREGTSTGRSSAEDGRAT